MSQLETPNWKRWPQSFSLGLVIFLSFGNLSCSSNGSVTDLLGLLNPAPETPSSIQAPTSIALTSPASSPTSSTSATIRVGGVGSGRTVKLYSDSTCLSLVGQATSAADSADIALTSLTVGSYTYYALSIDSGNSSSCSTVSLSHVVDLSAAAPASLLLQSPATDFEASAAPVIRVSPVEIGATVSLYSNSLCTTLLGSKVATSTSEDITLALVTPARYYIYAKQVDAAGNISSCSTASVRYIYANSFNVTSTTAATNNDAAINGICADAGAKCSLKAAFDEANAIPATPYLLILEAGTYTINTGFGATSSFLKLRGASSTTTILQGNSTSYAFSGGSSILGIENMRVTGFITPVGYDIFGNPGIARNYELKNVEITGNTNANGVSGVVYSRGPDAKFENVLFSLNTGGAESALHQWGGKITLKNVFFKDDTTLYGVTLKFCEAILENVTIKNSGQIGMHLNYPSPVTATNLTVTQHSFAGVYADINAFTVVINIYNSTFYNNGTGNNGNLWAAQYSGSLTMNIYNSIFAGNGAQANCIFSGAPTMLFRNSIFDEGSCTPGATNITGVNPQLNAFSTPSTYIGVLIPQITSPAIDAGNNAYCSAKDQLGAPRPVDKLAGGAKCDMGSVEIQ